MRIAIIGAGFTGLAAGYKLAKGGNEITIIEANDVPGGLATGFNNKNWKWELEQHYHHLFKTDYAIQSLAKEIGYKIIFVRPKTSTFYNNKILQIDSPLNLLKFDQLNIFDRIRTGFVLAYLKLTNSWQYLEQKTAKDFLILTMGINSWRVLWEPLLEKKFGKYAKVIPASWFWARVKSRTTYLGYPEGGFKKFAMKIDKSIRKEGGAFLYDTRVIEIKKKKNKFIIKTSTGESYEFDKVICTLPTNLFITITKNLPPNYLKKTKRFDGIGASNLILVLKKSFLKDGTYWLNINQKDFPFLCVVEHTNFISSNKYGGKKVIYIGNYLNKTNSDFQLSEKELLNKYLPYLKIINKDFNKSLIERVYLFKTPFAQPIITKNYSKKILPLKTPIDGLFLANIQQVYPWDRGTNYAVELGESVAGIIMKEND